MNLRSIALVGCCTLACLLPHPATLAADTLELGALKGAAYSGIDGQRRPVRLVQGKWVGRPVSPDSKVAPTVELAFDFAARGDLNADGRDEAVVVLRHEGGGSGSFVYLAVVADRKGRAVNVATQLLGDRVQVRDVRIAAGRLEADLVEPGPGDAACCPSRTVSRAWSLEAGRLRAQPPAPSAAAPGRLGLADLAGEWELVQWRAGEPAGAPVAPGSTPAPGTPGAPASQPRPTLAWQDGRLAGFAGCNRFTAFVSEGSLPGDIKIDQPATTRMACEEGAMAQERRFVELLGKVTRYAFFPGGLMLSYDAGAAGASGAMGFRRR